MVIVIGTLSIFLTGVLITKLKNKNPKIKIQKEELQVL